MNKTCFAFPTADTILPSVLVVGLALVGALSVVAIATLGVVT